MTGILKRAGLTLLLALTWLSLAWLAAALAEEGDRPAATPSGVAAIEAPNEAANEAADETDPARLRALAEQGDPDAQYALAHSYHLGTGVKPDMTAALAWYRKAAEQGHEAAQLALGDQYRIGRAVPRDPAQAARWYRMAADQGNAFAQYELGTAYRYGTGVPKNLVQAIRWYVASAEAGNPAAELALAELEAGDAADTAGAVAARDPAATPAETAAVTEPPAAETAPPDEAETVDRLLARADRQMADLALTVPAGDNAYETYQDILALEPGNQAARDGIARVGARYADLANLAAAKGDLAKARHYAAKAERLAPDHPAVRALAIPDAPLPAASSAEATAEAPGATEAPEVPEAPQAAEAVEATAAEPPGEPPAARSAETPAGTPPEILTAVSSPPATPPATPPAIPPAIPPATAAPGASAEEEPAAAPWVEPVGDSDDLIFRPQAYEGHELAVTGTVARLFGRYLLTSDNGQNSLVIDVNGLSPAARADLRDAVDRAGFLGQVEARIAGRIVRQTPVTFELAARELALATPAPAVSFETAGTAGESEDPLGGQPAPTAERVPTCYRDTVWRRLPDGRIQTGVRTRCY